MLRFGESEVGRTDRRILHIFLWTVPAVLALSALVRAVMHDESQYVAAIALMRQGLPYRDFAYLQTPLQPLILSPLAYLPAGSVLIGTRAANAAFGVGTILFVARALDNRASPGATVTTLAALLCTGVFLLASSLARNDALAMVLLAAALPPLLAAIESRSSRLFALAGLALGLSSSAKINGALPAAGAGLFLLLRVRHLGVARLLAFGAGGLLGLLPTVAMAFIAPDSFRFDVFDYAVQAPVQWWTSIALAVELDPVRRAMKLVAFATLGSILVALMSIALDRRRNDSRRMLDFMIVGGLVAAFLPVPALMQYLVPLLPPLFTRFALALDGVQPTPRRVVLGLAAVGSVAGLASNFVVRFAGLELVRSVAYGREVQALARGGRVVTLEPEYVAGGDVRLDPRFAAGPFLYRTRGRLGQMAQAEGQATSVQSVDAALTSRPPVVIVVGAERDPNPLAVSGNLDQPLVDWARTRGYRPIQLGSGLVGLVGHR